MNDSKWTIQLHISRQKGSGPRSMQPFTVEVDPDEYVLDAIERVWAYQDRSLTFRHACHHSTCGACGMLVNGTEKLTCITTIRSVTRDGDDLKIEPMRNFPVISDLVVDMSHFYRRMEATEFSQVAPLADAYLPYEEKSEQAEDLPYERLVDCIECGLCISACPPARTDASYLGPAVLAGIQHAYRQTGDPTLLDRADGADGAWRCHSAFECTAVCPSHVDPAWRIMDLRARLVSQRIRRLFHRPDKGAGA